jgi:uncharacterized membrane protein
MPLFTSIKQSLRSFPLLFIAFFIACLSIPVSLKYLNWTFENVDGVIVSVDKKVYSERRKRVIYYKYYAEVNFPTENITKNVLISEQIHKKAIKGDVYQFSRKNNLLTGLTIIGFLVAITHIVAVFVSLVVLIGLFIFEIYLFFL